MLEPSSTAAQPDRSLLDNEIRQRTAQGWQIVSQTPESVQFKRKGGSSPAPWAGLAVISLGLALLIHFIFWLGVLIGLIVAVAAVLMRKDEVVYVTLAELRERGAKVAAGAVMKLSQGNATVCSACGGAVRAEAKFCKHCKQPFTV